MALCKSLPFWNKVCYSFPRLQSIMESSFLPKAFWLPPRCLNSLGKSVSKASPTMTWHLGKSSIRGWRKSVAVSEERQLDNSGSHHVPNSPRLLGNLWPSGTDLRRTEVQVEPWNHFAFPVIFPTGSKFHAIRCGFSFWLNYILLLWNSLQSCPRPHVSAWAAATATGIALWKEPFKNPKSKPGY